MLDSSSTSVDTTLFGRTLKRSSELLGQVKSYLLLAAGVATAWFAYVKVMNPIGIEILGGVGVAVVVAPLAIVLALDTFPEGRARRVRWGSRGSSSRWTCPERRCRTSVRWGTFRGSGRWICPVRRCPMTR